MADRTAHGGSTGRALALVALLIAGVAFPVLAGEAGKDPRNAPMSFAWRGEGADAFVAAVGTIVEGTERDFESFAKTRDPAGAMMVLDSPGGSVVEAIALGRRLRALGVSTTVGSADAGTDGSTADTIAPDASCESMCVFVLLGGRERFVSPRSAVRVHQIWMGDRADEPKAASYSADDLMIVQRDIGSLIKYAYEMGATGDLMATMLKVPPWEPLHRLTEDELRLSGLATAETLAAVRPPGGVRQATAVAVAKPIQDRFEAGGSETVVQASAATADAN